MTTGRLVVGLGFVLGALTASQSAFASGGGVKDTKGKNDTAPKAGGSTDLGVGDDVGVQGPERNNRGAAAAGKSDEGAQAEEKPFRIWLDFVLGFGKQPVVNQGATPLGPGGTGTDAAPTTDLTKITTYSFLPGMSYEFAKGVGAAVRVPVSAGVISGSSENRGTVLVGNIELEGFYERELSETTTIEAGLGIALPTAQGTRLPDPIPVVGGGIDQAGYDRWAVQHAVAASRGFEENALFEPDHLGLIPAVKLTFHGESWHVDPWVKLENLVATKSGYEHSYTGELVAGVQGGYFVAKSFEPALRVWTNIPVAGADFKAVAVVEPQLRFHCGDVTPLVGVILPIAGKDLTSPYTMGIRLGIGGQF